VQEQLSRFAEYFAEVFSSEDISTEQLQHMEQLIADMQQALYGSQDQPSGSSGNSSAGGSTSNSSNSDGSSRAEAAPPALCPCCRLRWQRTQ
jgi:hypothetical protein